MTKGAISSDMHMTHNGSSCACIVKQMTEVATVTAEGMVKVPILIRRKHSIKVGDRVQFVEIDGSIMLTPVTSLSQMHGMHKEHAKALIEGIRELNREHRKEARE